MHSLIQLQLQRKGIHYWYQTIEARTHAKYLEYLVSSILFEGPAGSGKTTRLITALKERLSSNPLSSEQRVLAVTKMHGSRRRMELKLGGLNGIRPHAFECMTVDALAAHIVKRWCALLDKNLGLSQPNPEDFALNSLCAGKLLSVPMVSNWIAATHPIILVDELQDSDEGQVSMLRSLVAVTECYFAADEFQDLRSDEENQAVQWARKASDVTALETIHRTSVTALLEASAALRLGIAIPELNGKGLLIRSVQAPAMAGSCLSWNIRTAISHDASEIAIISATRPEKSDFVRKVLKWSREKIAKSASGNGTAGPYTIPWEDDNESIENEILEALQVPEYPNQLISCSSLRERVAKTDAHDISQWIERLANIGGCIELSATEVRASVKRLIAHRSAHRFSGERRISGMTIHQAKNREFDSVIVIWPLRIRDDVMMQRRLLYNAITRAKKNVVIIVEDPSNSRLSFPPFNYTLTENMNNEEKIEQMKLL